MEQSALQFETDMEFTEDVSANPRKRPIFRTSRGGWKACFFLLACNAGERMVLYGILSNLVVYMSSNLQEGTVTATKNVNNWAGATWITPILGAYIADTCFGLFWTFCVFSIIYVLGMILLVLCVTVHPLKPDSCKSGGHCNKVSTVQTAIFSVALYAIGVATGSAKPNISTIGAKQFDESDDNEKLQKASFFNWWMFSVFLGSFIGQTCSIYIQDNVGYGWGYGVLAIGYVVSLVLFLIGTPFYRHQPRNKENPFKQVAQVFVAAARKWRISLPSESSHFHELDPCCYSAQRTALARTPILRFLDKAAIQEASAGAPSPWQLCTVTQVEETKLLLKLIPVVLTQVIPCIILSQVNTLFVKEATTLNRKMGPHFEIPAGSLTALVTISMMVTVVLYERCIIKFLKKITGNHRGFTILQRMGTGYALQIIAMTVASVADARRVRMIKKVGLAEKTATVPLSVFILVPQFVVTGIANAQLEPAWMEFFYEESPHNMKSTATSFMFVTIGIGYYLSSLLLTVVNHVTGNSNGGQSMWIQNNLNSSRLYYYYALLAVLGSVNLLFFIGFSRLHTYRNQNDSELRSP